MIGLAAAALVSMVPMSASASTPTTKSARSKEAAKNHVWGTFKFKTTKRKHEAYGAGKRALE